MDPIEQIFLHVRSVGSDRTAEVAATTEWVRASDLTEIIGWFSESQSESMIRFDKVNLFFHPLPSGDFAVGMIYPAASGFFSFLRPPKSFFVRILIVPARTLLLKGNHPIALYEELCRKRKIPFLSKPPRRLASLKPSKEIHLADPEMLARFAKNVDIDSFARLNMSIVGSLCTLFSCSSRHSTTVVLSALFDLLPIRYRTELTFSTEIFFSLQYPFRLIGTEGDRSALKNQGEAIGVPWIFVDKSFREHSVQKESGLRGAWSNIVAQTLRSGNFDFLCNRLTMEHQLLSSSIEEQNFDESCWSGIDDVAAGWLRTLEKEKTFEDQVELYEKTVSPIVAGSDELSDDCVSTVDRLIPILEKESVAKTASGKSLSALAELLRKNETENPGMIELYRGITEGISGRNHLSLKNESIPVFQGKEVSRKHEDPILYEMIERLDSLVARGLFGDDSTNVSIRKLWLEVGGIVSWNEKDRLREGYLALLRSVLVQPTEANAVRDLRRSTQLFDMIQIFLE